ncbi:MAG: cytochrome c maturation protein CcmE [Bacteroidota bacterium]
MSTRNIVLLVILAVAAVAFATSFGGNVSTYTTFDGAKATDRYAHIVGTWVNRDDAPYNPANDLFQFDLQDTSNVVQRVHYYDPMPINFGEADRVVVEGEYKNGVFVAEKIQMKCPSKFEATELKAESTDL